jgi:hypothetical protein
MSDESSRGLLIAILIVGVASLLASSIQIGLTLRGGTPHAAASNLPSRYSEDELRKLAASLTEPYNRDDVDAIYKTFDDVAKNQVSRQKVADTLAKLRSMFGNIDSATYEGFKELSQEGGLPVYQLNYSVRLAGPDLPNGTMQINVIDRQSGPSILGFFVSARTQ